jgi:AraC-like DNA-binding protein
VPNPLFAGVVCTVVQATEWTAPLLADAGRPAAHYTLLVCRSGRARATIGEETYPLGPSTVLLIAPGVSFSLDESSGRGFRVVEVVFDAQLYGLLDVPALYGFPTLHRPTRASMEKIVQAAHRIVYDIGRARPGFEMAVNSHCLFILSFLWRDLVEHGDARAVGGEARAADLARLVPVLDLVEARYEEPITLHEMARAVHLHPAYFAAWFRHVTGIPPRKYLARYRLQRAAALLLATDEPLDQVAAATGHADRSHLSRAFVRTMGVTPGRYRRLRGPRGSPTEAAPAALARRDGGPIAG